MPRSFKQFFVMPLSLTLEVASYRRRCACSVRRRWKNRRMFKMQYCRYGRCGPVRATAAGRGYYPGYRPAYRPAYRPGWYGGYRATPMRVPAIATITAIGTRSPPSVPAPLSAARSPASRAMSRPPAPAMSPGAEQRYRPHRAYDNTFQPYNGPRQQCVSPIEGWSPVSRCR